MKSSFSRGKTQHVPVPTMTRHFLRSRAPALPVDRQHAAHDCHPHHADGAGHAHVEGTKVQRGQEEAKGASKKNRRSLVTFFWLMD